MPVSKGTLTPVAQSFPRIIHCIQFMKIWILQTGEPLHSDDFGLRPMRAINLTNALIEKGHHVTLWSSCFFHQKKCHRTNSFSQVYISPLLTILLIPSMGYKSNIGIDRLIDHFQLAFNLKRVLDSNSYELPDIAFIGYPPIEIASVMISWLKHRQVPTILDVKDLWPHIFVEAFPRLIRFPARIILDPYFRLAKQAIRNASVLTSMTNSYLDFILDFAMRKRSTFDTVLSLIPSHISTSDSELKEALKWWEYFGLDFSHSKRIVFVGSLSQAFSFTYIRDAIKMLRDANVPIEFVICGRGGDEVLIKHLFSDIPSVYFPGWISSSQICALMNRSFATIAPYKNTLNFTKNFPNKIIDSLGFGVPVITSLKGEVQRFIVENETGIFCNDDPQSWFNAFCSIYHDAKLRSKLSSNSLMEYNQRFTFSTVYGSFVKKMEDLVSA